MIKILIGLVLFLTSVSYSYGMSGDRFHNLNEIPGSSFGFERVQQQIERDREKRKRQQEEDAQKFTEERLSKRARLTSSEQESSLSTTSSSSSSSTGSEHVAGKSLLELPPLKFLGYLWQRIPLKYREALTSAFSRSSTDNWTLEEIPLELFEHIEQFISPEHRGNLALASTALRERSQSFNKHLAIPIRDITEEGLKNTKFFNRVTSITIYNSPDKTEILTPDKIALLATKFPNITSLNLSDTGLKETEIIALAQPGTFTFLKELDLFHNSGLGGAAFAILANAPFAPVLEYLNVEGTNLEETAVRALSQPGKFLSLKSLNVASRYIDNTSIAELASAPFAPILESLNLAGANITNEGIATLAQPHAFTSLKHLNLSHTNIDDLGIEELIEAPFIHKLESLKIAYAYISSDGVALLATPGKLTSLKHLNLGENISILNTGIEELIKAPFAHKLESLNLEETGITADALVTLANPGKLTALKRLNLSKNPEIGDQGIIALIKAPFARTLESLNLWDTGITYAGVTALATPNTFTSLKALNLSANNIGNAGIEELIKAPFVRTLESLNLWDTGITLNGVKLLATPGKLIALKQLTLGGTQAISDTAIYELINAPFAHNLEFLRLITTGITDTGVELLTQPNVFASLKELNLSHNRNIRDKSVVLLLNAPFAGKLKSLNLCDTGITTGTKKILLKLRIARNVAI